MSGFKSIILNIFIIFPCIYSQMSLFELISTDPGFSLDLSILIQGLLNSSLATTLNDTSQNFTLFAVNDNGIQNAFGSPPVIPNFEELQRNLIFPGNFPPSSLMVGDVLGPSLGGEFLTVTAVAAESVTVQDPNSGVLTSIDFDPSAVNGVLYIFDTLFNFTTNVPTMIPTQTPSTIPTNIPSLIPTNIPTLQSDSPTLMPSLTPTSLPTNVPSTQTSNPTIVPSISPSATNNPTIIPTSSPMVVDTPKPTIQTPKPTLKLTKKPTSKPKKFTPKPTKPTKKPTFKVIKGSSSDSSDSDSDSSDEAARVALLAKQQKKRRNITISTVVSVISIIVLIGVLCGIRRMKLNKQIANEKDLATIQSNNKNGNGFIEGTKTNTQI